MSSMADHSVVKLYSGDITTGSTETTAFINVSSLLKLRAWLDIDYAATPDVNIYWDYSIYGASYLNSLSAITTEHYSPVTIVSSYTTKTLTEIDPDTRSKLSHPPVSLRARIVNNTGATISINHWLEGWG